MDLKQKQKYSLKAIIGFHFLGNKHVFANQELLLVHVLAARSFHFCINNLNKSLAIGSETITWVPYQSIMDGVVS